MMTECRCWYCKIFLRYDTFGHDWRQPFQKLWFKPAKFFWKKGLLRFNEGGQVPMNWWKNLRVSIKIKSHLNENVKDIIPNKLYGYIDESYLKKFVAITRIVTGLSEGAYDIFLVHNSYKNANNDLHYTHEDRILNVSINLILFSLIFYSRRKIKV